MNYQSIVLIDQNPKKSRFAQRIKIHSPTKIDFSNVGTGNQTDGLLKIEEGLITKSHKT